MRKYKIRLESQTDDQAREVTLTAANPSEAKARVLRQEQRLVNFSLLPSEPVKPESPTPKDGIEAWDDFERQMANYEDAVRTYPARLAEAEQKLAELNEKMAVDARGRIVAGPKGKTRANWHAHHQEVPYEVVSCEEVGLEPGQIERLVSEAKFLCSVPEAWEKVLQRLRDEGIPLAAVTGFMYGLPVRNQYDGSAVTDWDTDTIKVALLTGHTPAQDTHDFFNDVSANEITGTGYTAGGATLGTKTITYDTASDQIRMDAADTTWTTSTLSATHAVVYKDTGTSTTSPVLGLVDFGGTVSTTAGTFQITWDATGILVIDVT